MLLYSKHIWKVKNIKDAKPGIYKLIINPKTYSAAMIKKNDQISSPIDTHEFRSCETVTILLDLTLQSIPDII